MLDERTVLSPRALERVNGRFRSAEDTPDPEPCNRRPNGVKRAAGAVGRIFCSMSMKPTNHIPKERIKPKRASLE